MCVGARFRKLKKISLLSNVTFLLLLTSCSFLGEKDSSNVVNNSGPVSRDLEVPPDLVKPLTDEKYNLPASGEARLSEFNITTGTGKKPDQVSNLLPINTDAYLINHGRFKVLVIEKSPEELWGLLKNFWKRNGFKIEKEMPESGLIETGWVESSEKFSDGIIRNTLGKIFDGLYSTGEKNKFRMRVERTDDGFSEISVVHKGLIQVASEDRFDPTVVWANKAPDQQLEELYLRKIIGFVSARKDPKNDVIKIVKKSFSAIKEDNGNKYIELQLTFDSAWKSVGIILDRLGFEVEERLKAQGIYLIRYKQLDEEKKEKGFFAKIFSSDKSEIDMKVYKIEIKNLDQFSNILVSDYESSEKTKSSQSILAVIYEQLN